MRRIPYALALGLLAAPALAAPQPQRSSQPQPEQATSSIPEAGDPEARRRLLNAQQADAARQQAADNIAEAQRYDAQVVGTELEAEHAASAYARTLRQHDAAVQSYKDDRKRWEVRNPACWDGSAAKCPAEPPIPSREG